MPDSILILQGTVKRCVSKDEARMIVASCFETVLTDLLSMRGYVLRCIVKQALTGSLAIQ